MTAHAQERSVTLSNGQALAYRSAGDDREGIPILFIHGIPGASDCWVPIMAELARTRPAYAVDLAGYGYSNWPDSYDLSLSAQAGYIAEFLEKRQISKVIVAGHDIGGGIAQIFAIRHPERVDRLILVNSVISNHWPVPEMRMMRLRMIGPALFALLEGPIWSYMLRKGFQRRELLTPDVLRRYRRWSEGAAGRRRLVRNARALDNTELTELSRHPERLSTATLILWGRGDRYLNATPAQQLCAGMPCCRFTFIENAGHFILDEQSANVAAAIRKFAEDDGPHSRQ
ncbi:MAG: hypothetical protein B7Z66_14755 [Chromatiales bacterium 21-64-14]|nr:MAG: hypothetical protein B7Z66_14755 [Chromatiales bacterium 21-64-14]HQU17293.1 alpha/beta hydrolase [Gammaproteobacteria bacterium]